MDELARVCMSFSSARSGVPSGLIVAHRNSKERRSGRLVGDGRLGIRDALL